MVRDFLTPGTFSRARCGSLENIEGSVQLQRVELRPVAGGWRADKGQHQSSSKCNRLHSPALEMHFRLQTLGRQTQSCI